MKESQKIEKLDIQLDNDDILLGVVMEGDQGLNMLFREDVNKDDKKAVYLQENIGKMLGLIAAQNNNLFNIIGRAFAECITEKERQAGLPISDIIVRILNDEDKDPVIRVNVDTSKRKN